MQNVQQLESEIIGHQSQIDDTLTIGAKMISDKHVSTGQVKDKCAELSAAWTELTSLTSAKRRVLDIAHKSQQYLSDAIEIESWMNEQKTIMSSNEYGQDEVQTGKLLARHRALQSDMTAY